VAAAPEILHRFRDAERGAAPWGPHLVRQMILWIRWAVDQAPIGAPLSCHTLPVQLLPFTLFLNAVIGPNSPHFG
jgi:hypothetical protein